MKVTMNDGLFDTKSVVETEIDNIIRWDIYREKDIIKYQWSFIDSVQPTGDEYGVHWLWVSDFSPEDLEYYKKKQEDSQQFDSKVEGLLNES